VLDPAIPRDEELCLLAFSFPPCYPDEWDWDKLLTNEEIVLELCYTAIRAYRFSSHVPTISHMPSPPSEPTNRTYLREEGLYNRAIQGEGLCAVNKYVLQWGAPMRCHKRICATRWAIPSHFTHWSPEEIETSCYLTWYQFSLGGTRRTRERDRCTRIDWAKLATYLAHRPNIIKTRPRGSHLKDTVNIKPEAQSVTPAAVSSPLKPSYFPNGLSYRINLFTTSQSYTICYFTYCPRVDIQPVWWTPPRWYSCWLHLKDIHRLC